MALTTLLDQSPDYHGDTAALIADARRWHDRDEGAHQFTDANALVGSLADALEASEGARANLEAVIAEARALLMHTHCSQDDHDDALGALQRAVVSDE